VRTPNISNDNHMQTIKEKQLYSKKNIEYNGSDRGHGLLTDRSIKPLMDNPLIGATSNILEADEEEVLKEKENKGSMANRNCMTSRSSLTGSLSVFPTKNMDLTRKIYEHPRS
jgi:hypothetical protein